MLPPHLTPHTTLSLSFPFCATPLLPPQGSSSSGRTRSFSLLPHLTPSSSPGSQRHLSHVASPSNIVTITHHKSPAAARRAKNLFPGRLLEVKEVGVRGVRIYIQPRALRREVQRREVRFLVFAFHRKFVNKWRWICRGNMRV